MSFGRPAAVGFGGFSSAQPATASGFGAPTGFGAAGGGATTAPRPGGFGAAAPAGGGFGAAPPAAGGFGGFGSTAGAQPAATGLGVGGFGTAPVATQAGAAGAAGFGGGFGTVTSAAPATASVTYVALDPTRQTSAIRLLMEYDDAYNGLHPKCKFRSFFYNICTPGTTEQAIARERYAAANAGGGASEEEWMLAQRSNPNPTCMYPVPVHFFQGVKARVDQQVDMVEKFHKLLDYINDKVQELNRQHEENGASLRERRSEQAMLERRWVALLSKVEVMRELGIPIGEEKEQLFDRAHQMLHALKTQYRYTLALSDLERSVECEVSASSASGSDSGVGGGGAGGAAGGGARSARGGAIGRVGGRLVDPHTLRNWKRFLEQMQVGLERLKVLVGKDLRDVRRVTSLLLSS